MNKLLNTKNPKKKQKLSPYLVPSGSARRGGLGRPSCPGWGQAVAPAVPPPHCSAA